MFVIEDISYKFYLLYILSLDQTSRTTNSTPTKSIPVIDESARKNAKSIDDLIESLNDTTEIIKSSSKKK
jgi:hypothetical protein